MPSEILESFQKIRRDDPQRRVIYLPASGQAVTTEQLAQLAAHLRNALHRAALPRGAVVAAALGNRPASIAAFLACCEGGHPFLPIDSATARDAMAAIGGGFHAGAVMTSTDDPIAGFSRRAPLGDNVTLAVADQEPSDTCAGAAVLKLTSGTTGAPRATLTSEAALVADSRTLMDAMGVAADDIQIAAIPLSHAYGFGNLLVPVLLQGTAIVMREAFVPQRLPEDARATGARIYPGVPFMFDFFNNHPPPDGWPPSLRTLISAGARLEQHTMERFRRTFDLKVHSFYGTTETGGICYDDSDDDVAEGTVGRPLKPVTVTLLPHENAPADGGRVYVEGPSVVRAYADDADAEVFADGGFLTGDLGAFDRQRRLVLSGRVSPFVNVAGRKVQPVEVERVLRELSVTADVRVLGVADARRGEQLVAFLVTRGPRKPTTLELRQFCASRLASYKIPRLFVFLDEMPLTARGKVDRAALEAAAQRASVGML